MANPIDNAGNATFNNGTSSLCSMTIYEKENNEFTPEQIVHLFPYSQEIGWSADQVRFLYGQNLIKGRIDEATSELYIYSDSFAQILEFHKSQQED